MTQFTKTRLHVVSAVLFLLAIYALAGLLYAAYSHNVESVLIWAIVAGLALLGGFLMQVRVAAGRRAAERSSSANAGE